MDKVLGAVNYSFLGKGDELYDARVWISDVVVEKGATGE